MADREIFENLVHDLSEPERMRLLKKLGSVNLPEQTVPAAEEPESSEPVPVRYELGILERLVIFLRSLFTSQSRMDTEEQYFISKLIRKLDKNYGSYFSLEKGEFHPSFGDEILKLAKQLATLRDPVQHAVRDKPGFIAFIVELECPETQNRLLLETDPRRLETELGTREIAEIRRMIEHRRESIFDDIKKNDKDHLYELIKGFYSLQMLISFPFERLPHDFLSASGVPRICAGSEIKGVLESFWEKIAAFKILPATIVLEALFLYAHQDVTLADQSSFEKEIREFMENFRKTMMTLRDFRQKIPMARILKVLNKNLDYTPRGIHIGGEEWFSLFRRFWEDRIQRNFLDYQRERKREELIVQVNQFLGHKEYSPLPYYRQGRWGEGISLSYDLTAAFLVNFVQTVFLARINPMLKLIQSEGDFYKEQNQQEFIDSYGSIFRLAGKIREIDQGFSDDGEYGRRISEIIRTVEPGPKTTVELRQLIANGEKVLQEYLFEFTLNVDLLVNVLGGILYGEVGGRYDSLSNLGYMGGANNDRVINSLKNIHGDLRKFLDLLHQVQDLERRQVL